MTRFWWRSADQDARIQEFVKQQIADRACVVAAKCLVGLECRMDCSGRLAVVLGLFSPQYVESVTLTGSGSTVSAQAP